MRTVNPGRRLAVCLLLLSPSVMAAPVATLPPPPAPGAQTPPPLPPVPPPVRELPIPAAPRPAEWPDLLRFGVCVASAALRLPGVLVREPARRLRRLLGE